MHAWRKRGIVSSLEGNEKKGMKEEKRGRDVTLVRFYLGKVAWYTHSPPRACIRALGRQGRRKLPGGFSSAEHEPIGGMGLKRPRGEPRSFAG